MLRKPYLYTDTVSYYSNNLPFEILHNNNILLNQLSLNIIENKNLQQGFLFGKEIQTNGIKDYFYINKYSDFNLIKIFNFNDINLSPSRIYKIQNAQETTDNTPLTASEIVSYMDENGFIKKQMVLNEIIYSSNVPNSNLLNLTYAKQNGFLKNEDINIDSLNVKFNFEDDNNNYIIDIDFASTYFIKKDGIYSLNIEQDSISEINVNNISLLDIKIDNYEQDSSDEYVSSIEYIKQNAPLKNDNIKLFISSPLLNSPVNKKIYLEKSNDFISLKDKKAYSIKIDRAKEISDSDVVTINEASNIVKDLIMKTTSLSFKSIDDFEKFFENICSNIEYLKKDLIINSDKGYVASYFNNVFTVINHKSFKRLLSQTGKIDQESYEVDKSSNYFNSILTTEDKNNFIKLAQSIGVNIDFVKDKFGDIFNKICLLIPKLSYPSPEDLKNFLNVDYAKPIYVNAFIVIKPTIQYIIKDMSKYIFYSPVYTKTGGTLIIFKPKIYTIAKPVINYSFNSPVYIHLSDDLNITPFQPQYKHKNYQEYQFLVPKFINTCRFDDLLSVNNNEIEAIWAKTRCQKEKVLKYSVISSNRAINGIELSIIYNKIVSSMDKNVYMCRECIVSKKLAALIISIYIIKEISSKYNLPVNINISKTISKIYSTYVQTQSSQIITVDDICGSSSSTQNSFIDSFISTNSVLLSTLDLDIEICQQSEMIEDFEINIDKFIISDNDISDAIDNISNMINNYYNNISLDNLNKNFSEFSSNSSCDVNVDKFIYDTENIEYGKVDLRYAYDCFSKNDVGSRKNDAPCENELITNKLSYWTFLYIEGEYGSKPMNLEDQEKGINSQTIGKLYVIEPDLININSTIDLTELKFFDKKEYGYIATIKNSDSFIYYDEMDDKIKYIGNFDINVENGSENDKFYIKINNLKINVNSDKSTIVETIDVNVDNFDFSFIHEINLSSGYSLAEDVLLGNGLSGMIGSTFTTALSSYDVQTKLDDSSIEPIGGGGGSSGADLTSKGSIASPVCEYITNPDNSFIPGHIKMKAKIDAFMVSNENGNKIIKNIGITIPFSFGIIDGYFNDELGELLANASSDEDIKKLLNNYQFNVKKYLYPDRWYNFMDISKIDNDSLIPENKISIDIAKAVKNLKKIDGEDLYFTKEDNSKVKLSDAEIVYGNKETVDKTGVYVAGIEIVSDGVYAKAVTKNKFMPIAILSANDGFKITNVSSENDIDLYKDTTYVAYNDMNDLISTIYLFKKPLYNNGIFMTFNQT